MNSAVTVNPCKLCAPLGASMAYRGIDGCMPLLHGSQGCSTYIRRYMISHFKEPVDIASSNFTEDTAIFGGADNLARALDSIIEQYNPQMIGVASTCLSETIGDDVNMFLDDYKRKKNLQGIKLPYISYVSTASYCGTHMDGFYSAVVSVLKEITVNADKGPQCVLFPHMASCADLRIFKEMLACFYEDFVVLPDYSDTLEGGLWDKYYRIPGGGTSVADIASIGGAGLALELGLSRAGRDSAAGFVRERFGVDSVTVHPPVGVLLSDEFVRILAQRSGKDIAPQLKRDRQVLLDSYADAHKYVYGKKVLLYGEEDLVISLAYFLCETGMEPVVCGTGAAGGTMKRCLEELGRKYAIDIDIYQSSDFDDLAEAAAMRNVDLILGNSKGLVISRRLDVPLVRVGFPVHDRIGAARIACAGYKGTLQLFDRIVNTLLEEKQRKEPLGFTYM